MKTEELEQLLVNLKLTTIARRRKEFLAGAERDGTPLATVLAQMLRAGSRLRLPQLFLHFR